MEEKTGLERFFKRRISRRQLLRGATIAGAGLAAASLGISGCTPSSEEFLGEEGNQVLSEEELQAAHIRIINTPEVSLKLKRGVFNFPLFNDALKGKLKEAVIILVDHENLSWNAGNKLPKEAKLVFQASRENPLDIPADHWEPSLDILEPEPRKRFLEKYAENGDRAIGLYKYIEPGWINVGIDKKFYKDSPEIIRQSDRYLQLKQDYPETEGNAYIFIAVGGKQKPHPEQSFPVPEQFKEKPDARPTSFFGDSYRYTWSGAPGPVLRHEAIGHYSSYGTRRTQTSEYDADTAMFKSIFKAANKKQSGDESGYPFVFVTAEGETITKNQQAPKGDILPV